MRTFGQLGGGGGSTPMAGLPGLVSAGVRAQPTVAPVPNNVPAGAQTGAPPRTLLYSRLISPSTLKSPTLIVSATPENRVVSIQPPNVNFTIYVGDAGVTPLVGYAVPATGVEIPLPGLQALYALTDAPTWLRVNIWVSIVLMAEQARPVGRIENEAPWRPGSP
jgi:hypothetical protein